MTELVYYNDTDSDRFSAEVLSVIKTDEGMDITLDKTCFYPEGGGQPADIGTIGNLRVNDVRKKDGIIIHSLKTGDDDAASIKEGKIVEATIDMTHRLDYMQQHSGQHVISAAMMKIAEIATVSVHQGEDFTSIETSEKEISPELIYKIEKEANSIITRNIPISSHWTDAEGAAALNLRRPTKHSSNIRIIEISGIDCVACGGMHLKTTGEIALIKYIRQEKIRGNIRTFWKIGDRAWTDYREKTDIMNDLCKFHSAQQHEITIKTEAAAENLNSLKFDYGKLQREYTELIAQKLILDAEKTTTGMSLVISTIEDKDRRFIENLRKQFSAHPRPILALIFNKTDGKLTWTVACSEKVNDELFNFNTFRSDYLPLISGKGGGKAPIWQGVAQTPDGIEELIKKFKNDYC